MVSKSVSLIEIEAVIAKVFSISKLGIDTAFFTEMRVSNFLRGA